MIKHIAGSGKKQGQWVACPAEKQCRIGGLHVPSETIQNIKTELRSRGLKVNLSDITEQNAKAWLQAHPDEKAWESSEEKAAEVASPAPEPELTSLDKIQNIQDRIKENDPKHKIAALITQGLNPEEAELQVLEGQLKTINEDNKTAHELYSDAMKIRTEEGNNLRQATIAYEKIAHAGNGRNMAPREHIRNGTPGYREASNEVQRTERLHYSAQILSTAARKAIRDHEREPQEIESRIKELKNNTTLRGLPERFLTHSDNFSEVGIAAYNNSVTDVINNKTLSDKEKEEHVQKLRSGLKETAKSKFQGDVNYTQDSLKNKIANLFERAVSHKYPDRGSPLKITSEEQKEKQNKVRGELKENRFRLIQFFNRLEQAPITSLISRDAK